MSYLKSFIIFLLLIISNAYSSIIMIPNENKRFESDQTMKAILAYRDGTLVEKEYPYNAKLEGVDVSADEPILSIFFPDQNIRLLKWRGEWVNEQGYYWKDGEKKLVEYPEWEERWNVYWDRDWHQHWRNHWSVNQENTDWPYRGVERWHNHWHRHTR